MNTRERAVALADAANHFHYLGSTSADDLLALVRAELGDERALDEGRAEAARAILHIVAGNTPAAGLQTLIRGLLLGAHNLAKLPATGLPDVEGFPALLPPALAAKVEFAHELPPAWLDRADAVVVFGSDATIDAFRARIRAGQIFIAHGHRVSFGVVFDDSLFTSLEDAARDVAAFDQLGCLSPHVIYCAHDPRTYAARLAEAMRCCEESEPRGAVPLSVANSIRALRAETAFRAANGEPCALWASEGSTAWSVIYDEAPGWPHTPLHRTVFVKPQPRDFAGELAAVREHLSCAGIFPATAENTAQLAGLGLSRICVLGEMQRPPWTWHQDGIAPLASLLRRA